MTQDEFRRLNEQVHMEPLASSIFFFLFHVFLRLEDSELPFFGCWFQIFWLLIISYKKESQVNYVSYELKLERATQKKNSLSFKFLERNKTISEN